MTLPRPGRGLRAVCIEVQLVCDNRLHQPQQWQTLIKVIRGTLDIKPRTSNSAAAFNTIFTAIELVSSNVWGTCFSFVAPANLTQTSAYEEVLSPDALTLAPTFNSIQKFICSLPVF